eukprot:GDKI01034485.1.p1 GENE.GDKI01034485.1~~GDKI01034485.1.p1  ORF type:complete len:417 (+),score=10.30 GDKI01034485.1:42-1292(+)
MINAGGTIRRAKCFLTATRLALTRHSLPTRRLISFCPQQNSYDTGTYEVVDETLVKIDPEKPKHRAAGCVALLYPVLHPSALTRAQWTGLFDAEGCFTYRYQDVSTGRTWVPRAILQMNAKEASLLASLIAICGGASAGTCLFREPNNAVQLHISNLHSLTLVEHMFSQLPFLTVKHNDFAAWRKLLVAFRNKTHLTKEGQQLLGQLVQHMNTQRPKGQQPGIMLPGTKEAWADDNLFRQWLSGFISGEGCFYLTGSAPNFQIRLHIRDHAVLEYCAKRVGVGRAYSWPRQNAAVWKVSSRDEIQRLRAYLDGFPPFGGKQNDYMRWCAYMDAMEQVRQVHGSHWRKILADPATKEFQYWEHQRRWFWNRCITLPRASIETLNKRWLGRKGLENRLLDKKAARELRSQGGICMNIA